MLKLSEKVLALFLAQEPGGHAEDLVHPSLHHCRHPCTARLLNLREVFFYSLLYFFLLWCFALDLGLAFCDAHSHEFFHTPLHISFSFLPPFSFSFCFSTGSLTRTSSAQQM